MRSVLGILLAGLAAGGGVSPVESPPRRIVLEEGFEGPNLDRSEWIPFYINDFRRAEAHPGEVGGRGSGDWRLILRANTMGTADDTVKYLGVCTAEPFDFAAGLAIEYELDWNSQENGSYLTAGVFLTPAGGHGAVEEAPDWIAFQYLGVPPGQNGRGQLARRIRGSLRFLETEGWPQPEREDRVGRPIGLQRVRWLIDGQYLTIWENGREYFHGPHALAFTEGHLCLEMSSHNNYRARAVYFDNVGVYHPMEPLVGD